MIFISAQPDDIYFTWQLELLLRNLHSLMVSKDKIHILIGYNEILGINPDFEQFINANSNFAEFYCYPDTRAKNISYVSTIRPHLLKKHFKSLPNLKGENIFYHDSDILFSRIPQIVELDKDDTCYVSDASRYLNREYITGNGSQELLINMLKVVGIGIDVLQANDYETGGAQYILKDIDSNFWEKVERDSEELYKLLKSYNEQKWCESYPSERSYRRNYRRVHAWCADMWAVLYNLWFFEKKVKVNDELDFSWPNSVLPLWKECSILHYSGDHRNNPTVFDKSRYKTYAPWYDEKLNQISNDTCSYKILEAIKERKKELESNRIKLEEVCIVLKSRKNNTAEANNDSIIRRYFKKHIDCSVRTIYSNEKEPTKLLPFEKGDFNQLLKNETKSNYFIFMPFESFISANMISSIYKEMSTNPEKPYKVYSLDNCFLVDPLFKGVFSELLDENLLKRNLNKFHSIPKEENRVIIVSRDITKEFGNNTLNLDLFDEFKYEEVEGSEKSPLFQL